VTKYIIVSLITTSEFQTSKVINREPTMKVYSIYLQLPGGNTDIIFLARMIEFSKAPVYQPEFPKLVIYHNIVGLHISVHNTL
jgi:hypothetical protein